MSAIIAKNYTSLESDSALLAGLTQSIGLSPILVKAESNPDLLSDMQTMQKLLYEIYPAVGTEILKRWDFSDHLVNVPAEHLDIHRNGDHGRADYTDIVQVALIKVTAGGTGPLSKVNEFEVSAFDRLGMREGIEEIDMSGGVAEMDEIRDVIS